MKTDTPRTDSETERGRDDMEQAVDAEFSRTMERELAAITATLRQCREALASCRGGVEAIQAADAALRLRPVAEHPSEIERGDGQNHEAE